jgi:hypothetical protein
MKAEIRAVLERLTDFKPKVRRQPDPRQGMLFGVLVPNCTPEPASVREKSEHPEPRAALEASPRARKSHQR